MEQSYFKRISSLILTASCVVSMFGCAANVVQPAETEENIPAEQESLVSSTEQETLAEATLIMETEVTNPEEATEFPEATVPVETVEPTVPPTTIPSEEQRDEFGMTKQQRNSFSMLYYLAITAEKIRISKDNRLILDDIYSELINDINPGAIDETTQDHLQNLRDIIKSYIGISTKRDRLLYFHNQDKAGSILNTVSNRSTGIRLGHALNWKILVADVLLSAADSYNDYRNMSDLVEQEFLFSGWNLDDEEIEAIQKNREQAFDYMVDMVQIYDLDGMETLNERDIESFAEICALDSVEQKTHRLEAEYDTYKLLGDYWLELVDCYYETGRYQKCLECIEQYKKLSTGIYRKDYNYVRRLPKAIVAAREIYSGSEYESNLLIFVNDILKNTTSDDWSARYFAAQVFMDLFNETDDRKYLERAYEIAYDNVAVLVDDQKDLNMTYLSEVQEIILEEPDYRFMGDAEKEQAEQEYKAEKKRVKAYNKNLWKVRETELPPVYGPLFVNCDLLFALAEELDISDNEKREIEAILRIDDNGVFLSKPVNDYFSFFQEKEKYNISFSKDEIIIPADLMTSSATVQVIAEDGSKSTVFDDCYIYEVERPEEGNLATFQVYVYSDKMEDYDWTENSKVTVEIHNGNDIPPLTFRYKVGEYKDRWMISDKVVFTEE